LKSIESQQQQQQGNIIHTTTTLSQVRSHLASTSSGELVFFGGGRNSTGSSDRVDIYNVTSGSWTTATLSLFLDVLLQPLPHKILSSLVEVGMEQTHSDRVDISNTTNGSWNTATLSQSRCCLAATSVGNLVLFGGGCKQGNVPSCYLNEFSKVVDVFNVTSNTWTTATLSQARAYLAATSVDNRYVLFGGGYNESDFSNVVDMFVFKRSYT
jgi:N-acetylneuraminic acid mutarotase